MTPFMRNFRPESCKHPKVIMDRKLILFVCEHGAAKSVVAAAHFNKLAVEKNLHFHAVARGTNPDTELSPITVAGLLADGMKPTESTPQKLSLAEVESAHRIVAFCELPEEYRGKALIERWDDIPPVSRNYVNARDAILSNLHRSMATIGIGN